MEKEEFFVKKQKLNEGLINDLMLEDELRLLENSYLSEKYSYKKGDIISRDGISIEITNLTKTNRLDGEPYYIYSGVILDSAGLKPKNKRLYKYKCFDSYKL